MKKSRTILLIEPNYKNKYPPIGLMKISKYHRSLGDKVEFFKGNLKDLVLARLVDKCVNSLNKLNSSRNWKNEKVRIKEYLRSRKQAILNEIVFRNSPNRKLLIDRLNFYSSVYRKKDYSRFPKWDRVYITTLFTFYWNITVSTIQYAKSLVKDKKDIFVGGVLASLLYKELEEETGITPHRGLLDEPGVLDPGNPIAKNLIIDDMPLDYSILDETEYTYPTGSAYFTFMTKGCT